MGLFPQSFIDDLKTQVDLVAVVQDYVPLKKAGSSFKGLCPFHGEKTPSFHVNRDRGFFHCFGCGVGGDVFKFLELQEKVAFPDAVRQLAQRFGIPVPELEGGPMMVPFVSSPMIDGGVKIGPVTYCRMILSASALSSGVKSIRSSSVRP